MNLYKNKNIKRMAYTIPYEKYSFDDIDDTEKNIKKIYIESLRIFLYNNEELTKTNCLIIHINKMNEKNIKDKIIEHLDPVVITGDKYNKYHYITDLKIFSLFSKICGHNQHDSFLFHDSIVFNDKNLDNLIIKLIALERLELCSIVNLESIEWYKVGEQKAIVVYIN